MARPRDPRQVLREAKTIAESHGCFVAEKRDRTGVFYLLYRRTEPNNTLIGRRATPAGIRSLVCKACNFH